MKLLALADRVRSSLFASWGLALACFVIALVVRFAANDLLPDGFPYLTFFPAVVLTAFFGGLFPGIACAIASGLAAWYFFIPPFGRFDLSAATIVALTFYVCIVAVDILLIEAMRRAMRNLAQERAFSVELAAQQQILLEDARVREKRMRLLQDELVHRMKNTLAMVQAVASQSLRHAASLDEASDAIATRIHALGRSQDILTGTNREAADIASVVEASLRPHFVDGGRWRIEGPSFDLSAMQGMGLALMLHELATNSVKYGALSNAEGTVELSWVREGESFRLDWRERGGPPVAVPAHRGFGSRLIERVVPGYFNGTAAIAYEPSGICLTLAGELADTERERELELYDE